MRIGVKNDINHYGHKNSIFIDAEHDFIRCFVVTPANIHDDYICADSAYSGERFKDLLSLARFENRIHEKGSRNHPLSAAATEQNPLGLKLELEYNMYLVVLPHQWEANLQEKSD